MSNSAIHVWRLGYVPLFNDLRRIAALIQDPSGLLDIRLLLLQYGPSVDRRVGEHGAHRYVLFALDDVQSESDEVELRHMMLTCVEGEQFRRMNAEITNTEWNGTPARASVAV